MFLFFLAVAFTCSSRHSFGETWKHSRRSQHEIADVRVHGQIGGLLMAHSSSSSSSDLAARMVTLTFELYLKHMIAAGRLEMNHGQAK